MEIADPRRIISRMDLAVTAEKSRGEGGTGDEDRTDLKELLSKAMAAGRSEIRSRFAGARQGLVTVKEYAYLTDQILSFLYDEARARRVVEDSVSEGISVVAVGGYGRGEFCPQSDVDLLFLTPNEPDSSVETFVQFILYALWDLGLSVGHATRSTGQCLASAREDWTVATNILDARFVYGNQEMAVLFRERLRHEFMDRKGREFLQAKIEERRERCDRMGDSRYMVEPNLKEGRGGLRDLQLLGWVAKFLYDTGDVLEADGMVKLAERGLVAKADTEAFGRAANFLFAVRCCLHWETGRGEDRLTFDLQPKMAELFSYRGGVGTNRTERFMKHYFLTVKRVSEVTESFLENVRAEHEPRSFFRLPPKRAGVFTVRKRELSLPDMQALERNPRLLLEAFEIAGEQELTLHPSLRSEVRKRARAVETLRDDLASGEIFLRILSSAKEVATVLREMNATGVLGRFVPEFGRVIAQNEHDMYHVYTVDEHTIRTFSVLSVLERAEPPRNLTHAAQVAGRVRSKHLLRLALLLHDIGKGHAGEHATVGAEMARGVCSRLGLSEDDTQNVVWLVEHHLYLAEMSLRRDLGDPQTITDIVTCVQTPERLRLLYVLTVCDINAIGPTVWTARKARLLENAFELTGTVLSGEGTDGPSEISIEVAEATLTRIDAAEAKFRERVADWPPEEVDAFVERSYSQFWVMHELETVVKTAMVARETGMNEAGFAIDCRPLPDTHNAEVIISAPSGQGLFARVVMAITLAGMSVADAKIITTRDGMALYTFVIALFGNADFSDDPRRLETLSAAIEKFIVEKPDLKQLLADRPASTPSRTDVFKVTPSVIIDNKASRKHTVLEIVARDHPGLLATIALAILDQGLAVSSARIATYGEKVSDVFYVQTRSGKKISGEVQIEEIRKGILAFLSGDSSVQEKKTV